MPDGRVTGTGYNPWVDNNIGLYGQRLNELLSGFNARDNLDNPYSNALIDLNERDRQSAQRRLGNELNAIGQAGGSYDALMRRETNKDFDTLAIKNRLAGFDAILQAMNSLNTGGIQQQQQKLLPIQQALQGFQVNNGLNAQRAMIPLQGGMQQGQNIMQAPTWFDQYTKYISAVGSAIPG